MQMKSSTKEILAALTERYQALECIKDSVLAAYNTIAECYKNDGKLLVCGNGGSAADALHMVGELMKTFALSRKLTQSEQVYSDYLNKNLHKALPAISLVNEVALMTAYANDVDAELVFAQQVYGYGKPGDILFAISTSGNSANVLYAAEVAKAKNMKIVSLTGQSGGKLLKLSDVSICVPENETYKIQELHLPVYHVLCRALENEFFGS